MSAPVADEGSHRTVVVIRHAHAGHASDSDAGSGDSAGSGDAAADHGRALDRRGRREATAAGKWLAESGPALDLVLVSDAVRTRQTWELISAELTDPPAATVEARMYNCSPDDLIDLLTADRARRPVVAVVGHNLAVSELAWFLTGHGGPALAPAAIAVIEVGTHAGICPGHLIDGFNPPR